MIAPVAASEDVLKPIRSLTVKYWLDFNYSKGKIMKMFQLSFIGLAILSTSALASDSGPLERETENIFRYESTSEDGKCKIYVGPKLMEAFKASDSEAKVAEFTSLNKMQICQDDDAVRFVSDNDIVVQNSEGFYLSDVELKLEVKDETERRVGKRQAITPTLTSTCGTEKKTLSKLGSTITKEQFDKAHLLVLEIDDGLWNTCE